MIRNLIKKWFSLYDIGDLVTGSHCGCCGHWMPNEIVPKSNTWSLCHKCIDASAVKRTITQTS